MLNAFAVVAGLSVSATVMILILLLTKRIWKQRHGVSRRAFVFLWLLVFLRMCLPFGVDLWQPAEEGSLPGQMVYSVISQQLGTEAETLPAALAGDSGEEAVNWDAASGAAVSGSSAETLRTEVSPSGGLSSEGELSAKPASLDGSRGLLPLAIRAAAVIWAAGALALATMFGLSYVRMMRGLRRMPERGVPLIARSALLNAKAQTGIGRRRVRIRLREGTGGAVYGVFRPTILLGRDSVLDAEMILTHECVHIRHWDNLLKVFALAALTLHWFNPAVWVGIRSFWRDIEMACDERVVKCIQGDVRKQYAVTILGSSRVRGGREAFSYFGESPVSERVKHVLGIRRRQIAVPVIGLMMAVFLLLGCFASPVAAVAEEILEYGGTLQSGFLDLTKVAEEDGEILDYTAYENGVLFVLREDVSQTVKIEAADASGQRRVMTELGPEQGEFTGAVYYHDGALYYSLRSPDHIDVQSVDVTSGEIAPVIRVSNTQASMRLFGGGHFLCWYEEQFLRVLDLETGRMAHSFQTNGNQDYGAMMEGYFAYQYEADSDGTTKIRCVNPDTEDAYEVVSRLGQETFSVYGNSRFLIYKEEYKLQSECFVYDREKDRTVRLLDLVDPGYVDELNAKQWGITLVGNRLLICGEGNAVYEVNLETGETVRNESGLSGIGFYHLKNSDGNVSAMLFTVQDRGLSGSGNLYVGTFQK